MRYLPKSPADREAMLKAIGARSIDDLFAPIPAEYRLNRDLKVPRQMAESEIVDWFRPALQGKRHRVRQLPGRGRLHALPPGDGRFADLARRISHLLHALPGRDLAGHAAGHLRIPDHDLPADRHGSGQRLHVRRLDRRARSRHDGGARHRAQLACVVAQEPASGISRSARDLRAAPGHAGGTSSAYDAKPAGIDLEELEASIDDRHGVRDHSVAELLRHRRRRCSHRRHRAQERRAAGGRRSPKRSRWVSWSRRATPISSPGKRSRSACPLELRRAVRRGDRDQGKIRAADAGPAGRARPRIATATAASA